jgi:hypothetical protein
MARATSKQTFDASGRDRQWSEARAHITANIMSKKTANKKLHWVHYFNQTGQVLSEDLQNMVRAQIY